ncbi:MAG: hypothetical protein ACRYG4_08345 [Janthinobacterium lividum]
MALAFRHFVGTRSALQSPDSEAPLLVNTLSVDRSQATFRATEPGRNSVGWNAPASVIIRVAVGLRERTIDFAQRGSTNPLSMCQPVARDQTTTAPASTRPLDQSSSVQCWLSQTRVKASACHQCKLSDGAFVSVPDSNTCWLIDGEGMRR